MKTHTQWFLPFALVATLFLIPGTAGAQSNPTPPPRIIGSLQVDPLTTAPQQLIRSVSLAASPQQVFEVVTDHETWPQLLSILESVQVSGDGRRGSTRTFTLQGGATVAERILA